MNIETFIEHVQKLSEDLKRDKQLNPLNFVRKIIHANQDTLTDAATFFNFVVHSTVPARTGAVCHIDSMFVNTTWSDHSKSSAVEAIMHVCKYPPLASLFVEVCTSAATTPSEVLAVLDVARKNYKYVKKSSSQPNSAAQGERTRKQPYWMTELENLRAEVTNLKSKLDDAHREKTALQQENVMLEHSISMHKEFADRMLCAFRGTQSK